jgi:hypothetical protein
MTIIDGRHFTIVHNVTVLTSKNTYVTSAQMISITLNNVCPPLILKYLTNLRHKNFAHLLPYKPFEVGDYISKVCKL